MARRKDGFTLAELLIVVAIISVLVALSMPIFSSMLERSMEATDIANIRGQYAEVMTEAISTGKTINKNGDVRIPLVQKQKDWQNEEFSESLRGFSNYIYGTPRPGYYAWVSYEGSEIGTVIHFEESQSVEESGEGIMNYPADTSISLNKLGRLSKNQQYTIYFDSSSEVEIEIELVGHAGQDDGMNSKEKCIEKITIMPGQSNYIFKPDKNCMLAIRFLNEIDKNVADELVRKVRIQ